MNTLSYKTVSANANTVNKEWVLIDAENEILGRMASAAAKILRGKHKPNYTPHVDCGDNVIIINADKIRLTGNKWDAKEYIRHSGYPGGQRSLTARELMERNLLQWLRKQLKVCFQKLFLELILFRNLYVYAGSEHEQQAQKPRKSI